MRTRHHVQVGAYPPHLLDHHRRRAEIHEPLAMSVREDRGEATARLHIHHHRRLTRTELLPDRWERRDAIDALGAVKAPTAAHDLSLQRAASAQERGRRDSILFDDLQRLERLT